MSTISVSAKETGCHFAYDQSVIDSLVIPALKKSYGANYTIYDTKNPAKLTKKRTVELIFSQSRIDVLDPPNFVIEIDSCRKEILKAYEISPFPAHPK